MKSRFLTRFGMTGESVRNDRFATFYTHSKTPTQGSLVWLIYDGHGNLARTMDASFNPSDFQWRDPWGVPVDQSDLGLKKGYCANLGHGEDEYGLVYMRARSYEPGTGRFVNQDPGMDGRNWYLYADGNPVNRVDESGLNDDDENPYASPAIRARILAILVNFTQVAIRSFFNGFALPMFLAWTISMGLGGLLFGQELMMGTLGKALENGWAMGTMGAAMGTWLFYDAFKEATLAGKVENFWLIYGSLMLLTIQVLELEYTLITGY